MVNNNSQAKRKRGRPKKIRERGLLPNNSLTRKVLIQKDWDFIIPIAIPIILMILIAILVSI